MILRTLHRLESTHLKFEYAKFLLSYLGMLGVLGDTRKISRDFMQATEAILGTGFHMNTFTATGCHGCNRLIVLLPTNPGFNMYVIFVFFALW